MPARLPLARHAVGIALLLPLLAGCGPPKDVFAPPCPQPTFPKALADLTRYNGKGHDLTDLVLRARLLRLDGSCEAGETKDTVVTTLTVSVEAVRGPALSGNQTDLPVFIAVTDGGVIRDKKIYTLRAEFGPNVQKVTVTSPRIRLMLPVSQTKSAAAYGVIAGFQLTPAELAVSQDHAAPQ